MRRREWKKTSVYNHTESKKERKTKGQKRRSIKDKF